ncbi:hypothetical protein L2E82_51773 [Cichorium intybus]|nr:hypothetical protein L2E82_51773 [Cichorium intybus]
MSQFCARTDLNESTPSASFDSIPERRTSCRSNTLTIKILENLIKRIEYPLWTLSGNPATHKPYITAPCTLCNTPRHPHGVLALSRNFFHRQGLNSQRLIMLR